RAMRATRPGGHPPDPQTRQPRKTRTGTTGLGGRHGQEKAQDPRGLPPLPRHHPQPAHRRQHGVDHWRATYIERCPRGSAGGCTEKDPHNGHLAAQPTQWRATWSLHAPDDPAAEAWVLGHALTILDGQCGAVATAIRAQAAELGEGGHTGADDCVAY